MDDYVAGNALLSGKRVSFKDKNKLFFFLKDTLLQRERWLFTLQKGISYIMKGRQLLFNRTLVVVRKAVLNEEHDQHLGNDDTHEHA